MRTRSGVDELGGWKVVCSRGGVCRGEVEREDDEVGENETRGSFSASQRGRMVVEFRGRGLR
jgi:hypothetical protein